MNHTISDKMKKKKKKKKKTKEGRKRRGRRKRGSRGYTDSNPEGQAPVKEERAEGILSLWPEGSLGRKIKHHEI